MIWFWGWIGFSKSIQILISNPLKWPSPTHMANIRSSQLIWDSLLNMVQSHWTLSQLNRLAVMSAEVGMPSWLLYGIRNQRSWPHNLAILINIIQTWRYETFCNSTQASSGQNFLLVSHQIGEYTMALTLEMRCLKTLLHIPYQPSSWKNWNDSLRHFLSLD